MDITYFRQFCPSQWVTNVPRGVNFEPLPTWACYGNHMADEQKNAGLVPLSQEEQLFCVAYASCWNAGQAYSEAISPDCRDTSAASGGCRLLKRPEIQAEIQRICEERKAQFNLSGDLILHELMCIGFSSLASFMNENGEIDGELLAKAPANVKRALEQVETTTGNTASGSWTKTKVKMHNKIKALELLGKSRGIKLFVESTEVTDPNRAPMEVQVSFKRPDKPNDQS